MIINKIESHCFCGWTQKDIIFDFDTATRIAGKNSTGKTTVANALTMGLLNCDFWGNKIYPFNNGDISWLNFNLDGKNYRRLWERKNGKVSCILSEKFELPSKDLTLSLLNPLYLAESSPATAKNIILDSQKAEHTCLFASKELEAKYNAEGDEDYENLQTVMDLSAFINAKIKAMSEAIKLSEIAQYKLDGAIEYVHSAGIKHDFDSDIAALNIKKLNLEKDKEFFEKAKSYMEGQLIQKFNAYLKGCLLLFTGKDGSEKFSITYYGKEWKTLSFSEKIKCGLEIVDALSALSKNSLPCIIDNVESIDTRIINLKDYDYIKQFIILGVADCELGYCDGKDVYEPISKRIIGRIQDEAIVRKIEFISGWGN